MACSRRRFAAQLKPNTLAGQPEAGDVDILVPPVGELAPMLVSLAVLVMVIGGAIYLILLLRRSVRAQERLAAALASDEQSIDGAESE